MCVDVVTKGTVEGETRESTFAQGRSELAVGSPCEVSIRGWMGWDGSTHTLSYRICLKAAGRAGRKLGIDHNQLFAQSIGGSPRPPLAEMLAYDESAAPARAGVTHVIWAGSKKRPGVGVGPWLWNPLLRRPLQPSLLW